MPGHLLTRRFSRNLPFFELNQTKIVKSIPARPSASPRQIWPLEAPYKGRCSRSRRGRDRDALGLASRLDLGRVTGRSSLISFPHTVVADFGANNQYRCSWPLAQDFYWRPRLRSISATIERENRLAIYTLQTDGLCETALIRSESGANAEFALATRLPVLGRPLTLFRYGARTTSDIDAAFLSAKMNFRF